MAALAKVTTRLAALTKDSRGCVCESVNSHGCVGGGADSLSKAKVSTGLALVECELAWLRARGCELAERRGEVSTRLAAMAKGMRGLTLIAAARFSRPRPRSS